MEMKGGDEVEEQTYGPPYDTDEEHAAKLA